AEIESNAKARAVREALIGGDRWRVLGTVMLVRFPPNSPFALMNGLLAATEVPIGTYVLGTALGMAPRTLAYAWIGTQVSDWDTVGLPAWLKYGGLVVTLIVLAVIGQVANKAIERVTRKDLCSACGYDLRGLRDGVCPECGAAIEASDGG
ncbi:MAG: VTT domain-containing protein, partial [Phycisphaerales bacterium]